MFLAHLAQTRRRLGLAALAVQLCRAPNVQTSVPNTVFAGSTTEGRRRHLTAKSNMKMDMEIEKKLHFQNHHIRNKQVIWGEGGMK